MRLYALTLLLTLSLAVATASNAEEGFHPGPGYGFGHGNPDFDHDGPGYGGFRPGYGGGFRPGYGPDFNRGWRPGFNGAPGWWGYRPLPVPAFNPYPGWVPGPAYWQGYVYTCFAQSNFGQSFYATALNPNLAAFQALQYCAASGAYCVPAGCR